MPESGDRNETTKGGTVTTRDLTWHVSLMTKILRLESFKRRELGFDDSERHTVQRALKSMERFGWLHRETERGSIWEPGVIPRWIVRGEADLSESERERLTVHLEELSEQTGLSVSELRAGFDNSD